MDLWTADLFDAFKDEETFCEVGFSGADEVPEMGVRLAY
jgi:hypothetical protein